MGGCCSEHGRSSRLARTNRSIGSRSGSSRPTWSACLPTWTASLSNDADSEAEAKVVTVLGRDLNPWENAYVIGGNSGPAGWVVGGSVNGRADVQPFDAPTMFDGWSARTGVTELFTHNGP